MKEQILEILKSENRKLNSKEIMDIINPNNTVDDLRDLIDELQLMCRDGLVRTSDGNTFVINDLLVGTVDLHEKGNAHIIIPGQDDLFIPRDKMKGALDKDTVSVEITDKNRNEGRVVNVLKRSLGRALGEVVDDNGHMYIRLLDENLPYDVEIEDTDINLVDGLIVHLDYIKDLSRGKVLAKVDYVIGHKNAVGNDTMFAMIGSEFNRRTGFPPEVEAEAKLFPSRLTSEEVVEAIKDGRVDLRYATITTIDGKDTKDIDDAINNEVLPNGNYLEFTCIADVSNYVKIGSAIWDYAEGKGNSDYWGNKVAPMLPIELSNGICSLNPNEDRFAVTVSYELDHAGNIINPQVYLTVIKSKKKMNYDAVQDIIDGKDTEDTKDYTTLKYTVQDGETIESIAFKYALTREDLLRYTINGKEEEINKLEDFVPGKEVNIPTRAVVLNNYVSSKIMGDSLKRRGKIDFEGREPKYIFDENDKVIDIQVRVQREAEKLIENKMLYANQAFAMFMVKELSKITSEMIPFVFRVHGQPNPKKIQEFLDMLNAFGITIPVRIDPENVTSNQIAELLDALRDQSNFQAFNDKLLRCMQKAVYSTNNIGHFGTGLNPYCHFTSPIRRMADLLVHTLFRVFCVEKNHDPKTLKFWANYLDDICEKISTCEQDAEKCEYAIDDYLNATYMEDRLGTILEGNVDGLMPSGFFAATDKCIDGRVDYFITEEEAEELSKLTDQNERLVYIEEHKKVFSGFYDLNEKMFGYSRNGRMCIRYGDRIEVCCIGAYPERREVDFAMVRKI